MSSPLETVGLTAAVDGSGRVTVVTNLVDDGGGYVPDSILRRFSGDDGELLTQSTLFPRVEVLRADPSGHLIAAGSRYLWYRQGRGVVSLWFGGLEGTKLAWQQEVGGAGLGFSRALDLYVPTPGRYVVAGARGTGPYARADAWVGSGTTDGGWSWNAIPLAGSEAVSLCLAQEGDVVVAGPEFVARFDPRGKLQWIRSLDTEPTVVHCLPEGYLLGFAARFDPTKETIIPEGGSYEVPSSAYLPLRLELRAWDHALLWRQDDPECQAVQDLKSQGTALFVLKSCDRRFGLTRYDLSSDLHEN